VFSRFTENVHNQQLDHTNYPAVNARPRQTVGLATEKAYIIF